MDEWPCREFLKVVARFTARTIITAPCAARRALHCRGDWHPVVLPPIFVAKRVSYQNTRMHARSLHLWHCDAAGAGIEPFACRRSPAFGRGAYKCKLIESRGRNSCMQSFSQCIFTHLPFAAIGGSIFQAQV